MSEIFIKLRIKEILKGNMKRYLMFGFVEIFLVVAGILIALAINNWNINKSQRNDEVRIYREIREKIQEDKSVIQDDRDYNNHYLVLFKKADRIIADNNRSALDTLVQIVPDLFRYSDFDKSSYIYQNLMNSGELKILDNAEITSELQELEEAYIYVNRMENIHWQLIIEMVGKEILNTMDLSTGESVQPEILYSYQFHNQIFLLITVMEEKDDVYERTMQQIDHLSSLIDQEIARR